MAVWNSMLLKITIICPNVVEQHVRFIYDNFTSKILLQDYLQQDRKHLYFRFAIKSRKNSADLSTMNFSSFPDFRVIFKPTSTMPNIL